MAHSTIAKKKQQKFSIKANTSIGCSAAEDDSSTLHECFVTTDLLADVLDTSSSKSILLGRTGSGKSAAIMHIKEKETNIIEIEPENLALNYISNSDIISFFEKLGLNLDNFYQLLWRHVLCVELLNFYFYKKKNKDKS
ncbi:MAG: P-loop ATPase, Sll1717 family, partial [Geminicoccaceae bacterium]